MRNLHEVLGCMVPGVEFLGGDLLPTLRWRCKCLDARLSVEWLRVLGGSHQWMTIVNVSCSAGEYPCSIWFESIHHS